MADEADFLTAARADPALVVLEGVHALKHALRFGADVLAAGTTDPDGLAALAEELAPDLALAGLVATVGDLGPDAHHTGVVAVA
ncbi:MAG: rRNA methyltransferase, partial [Solirubrobacteraceae bacterium]